MNPSDYVDTDAADKARKLQARVEQFQEWAHRAYPNPAGWCADATNEALALFPHWGLRRVRGHYHCPIWGRREHWWCRDEDGVIFDPTVSQFPSNGTGDYEEWDETRQEPVGLCMNCGDYVFAPRSCTCSEKCEAELNDSFL